MSPQKPAPQPMRIFADAVVDAAGQPLAAIVAISPDAARDAGVTPNLLPLVSRAAGAAEVPEEVRQVLFGLKPHDPAMVENAQGFIVLTPVEIVAPDPVADADPYARLGQALAKTVANDMSSLFQEALRARANARINQQNLDQLIRP